VTTPSTEIREATRWIRKHMTDPDVKAAIHGRLTRCGYQGLSDFSRQDPDGFIGLYDALVDMVEQIPEADLQSVDGHGLR
jgi:hypothetical protein